MKNYRVCVETNDGCVTIWYEKSKAKNAHLLINNRVYNQLCGLNIKEVSVTLSVWIMNYNNFWDNVLKQEEWSDELKRWENTHPEYKPFKEDSDSQRQQNLSNWIKVSNLQSSSIV